MRIRSIMIATVAVAGFPASGSAAEFPATPGSQPAVTATAPPAPTAMAAAAKKKKTVPRFVFTFNGRGFGHGVGMSQYGAYGAALAGMSSDKIIGMYYPGTALTSLPATEVRVLLAASPSSVRLAAREPWAVVAESAGAVPVSLPVGVEIAAKLAGGAVVVESADGTELFRAAGAVRFAPTAPAGLVAVSGTRYRGQIRVVPGSSSLTVVNHVDLEQYLPGVVPREMPPKWGDAAPAALEAQAIAARSYAMATRKTSGLFDMYADVRSQVYGGASSEDSRTTRAVQATAGKVVTYQGAIVTTFFFSTSGGRTENVENVFRGSPRPYLVSIDDSAYDLRSPHHVWSDAPTYTDAQLARLLGTKQPVLSITVVERGVSPRVKTIRITTRSGAVKTMRGSEVRSALGLRDTWFTPRRRVRTPATLSLVSPLPRRLTDRSATPLP